MRIIELAALDYEGRTFPHPMLTPPFRGPRVRFTEATPELTISSGTMFRRYRFYRKKSPATNV